KYRNRLSSILKTPIQARHNPTAMLLLKRSSKNQLSSADLTPAQTPRVSMQDERPAQPTEKGGYSTGPHQ
ncbi:hypothetical protein BGZ79_005467, partial [Entomortierella chlamydospora]